MEKKIEKGMKVKYIGTDNIVFEPDEVYTVLDIDTELGWPEIEVSDLDNEVFIFPPEMFEIIEEK